MSELKVTTFESTGTVSANTIVADNATINSTGLFIGSNVSVTNNYIEVDTLFGNAVLSPTISTNGVIIGNTNVFAYSNDVFAWVAGATSNNNSTYERDFGIERSPFGGIPMKIIPSGSDPYPMTYNSNTWNLARATDGETWKISGYIRANNDIQVNPGGYLLVLPANSSGAYGTAGTFGSPPTLNLKANQWQYFELVDTINGNANTAYMQIRPDGIQDGNYITWYDGIKVERVTTTIYGETVNTQIFTANGIWGKPSWATTGNELVIVHMWGGGGGGNNSGPGGGGAFVFGYYKANQLGTTANVVVGTGGSGANTSAATAGDNSSFANSTNGLLTAYGGGAAYGGGGGWFSAGGSVNGAGGVPLGGAYNGAGSAADSTFGGSGPRNSGGSGWTIYGGGGGSAGGYTYSTVFGGAGGSNNSSRSLSFYGGAGGANNIAASAPGGGGGCRFTNTAGARGEVRIYTLRYVGP